MQHQINAIMRRAGITGKLKLSPEMRRNAAAVKAGRVTRDKKGRIKSTK